MGTAIRPVPKRWNLGGIPVFQAEVPGRVRAALEFRVGTADEPLHMAGVTHLIEHLALHGLGNQTYDYNGFVDNTHTAFLVTGTADQVKQFFAHVCVALQALPRDRVATERRVIETEAAGHHQTSFRNSLSFRYGASGFGTADYRQIGLLWLTPEAVQDWANKHFTAGNAAAWVAGPVIPGLKIELPPGGRLAPPSLTPKKFRTPCVVEDPSLGATISMVTPRSTALWAGMGILERRGMQRIRFNEGLSYGVQATTQDLDGRMVHALASTDAMVEHATKAGSALLDVADVLSLTGPEPAELQFVGSALDEAMSDPQSVVQEMERSVENELLGLQPYSLEARRAEVASLTPSAVAAAMKEALDTAIVIMPPGGQSPRPHYAPYPTMDARPLRGSEVPSAWGTGERMVVGPSGIALSDADRRAYNILWQDIAVGARWDDGTRLLIARDGTEILFRPHAWRNPQLILAAIETNAPADRVIQADTPSPSAEMPAPPKVRRRGSILAGRANLLMMAAGLLLALVAGSALLVISRGH
jgi:predicted Zn-dependent peptidase